MIPETSFTTHCFSPSLFLWKGAYKKLNTVCKDCVKIIHPCWSFACDRSGIQSPRPQVQRVPSIFFFSSPLSFLFFHRCPYLSSFTAWPVGLTPLACWLTHHPAAPLPVIKRSVMATTVRGWKNVLQLPGSEEVRWTLSPGLKGTLMGGGGGEGGALN